MIPPGKAGFGVSGLYMDLGMKVVFVHTLGTWRRCWIVCFMRFGDLVLAPSQGWAIESFLSVS